MKSYIIEMFECLKMKFYRGIAESTAVALQSIRTTELKIAKADNINYDETNYITMRLTKGYVLVNFDLYNNYLLINISCELKDEGFEGIIDYFRRMLSPGLIKYTSVELEKATGKHKPKAESLEFDNNPAEPEEDEEEEEDSEENKVNNKAKPPKKSTKKSSKKKS